MDHIESLTQNIIGIVVAFIILKLWGMPTFESIALQATFFCTSYVRGYLVRKFFRKLELRK